MLRKLNTNIGNFDFFGGSNFNFLYVNFRFLNGILTSFYKHLGAMASAGPLRLPLRIFFNYLMLINSSTQC